MPAQGCGKAHDTALIDSAHTSLLELVWKGFFPQDSDRHVINACFVDRRIAFA